MYIIIYMYMYMYMYNDCIIYMCECEWVARLADNGFYVVNTVIICM